MNDMTEDDFTALTSRLAELNDISTDLAADIIASTGDMPAFEEDGTVIVEVDGAPRRLIWPEDP